MATTTIGYRGKDVPVGYNGGGASFITRVQSFEVTDTRPTTNTYELGTTEATGAFQDATRFRGTLTKHSDGIVLDGLFGGGTAALTEMIEADGFTIMSGLFGISDAKFVSVNYTGRVDGFATETWTFQGSSGSTGSVTATTPVAGNVASRAPKMAVTVGGTTGSRVQGYSITASVRGNELSELTNASIVGIVFDQPSITVDIDWVQSTAIAGNNEYTPVTAATIAVVLTSPADAAVKTITVQKCITTGKSESATVGGWATKRISYQSACSSTDSGLTLT